MAELEIRIFAEEQIDAALDEGIRELLGHSFPHRKAEYARSRVLGENVPAFTVLAMLDERPVGHVAVVDRRILAGGVEVRVAGVANVCVDASFRGRRLARRMLEAAMERAKQAGFDFGMLFCQAHVVEVYRRAGWVDIPPGPISYTDGGVRKQIPQDRYRLYYPLNRTEWPAGPVDLKDNRW